VEGALAMPQLKCMPNPASEGSESGRRLDSSVTVAFASGRASQDSPYPHPLVPGCWSRLTERLAIFVGGVREVGGDP